MRPPLDLLDLPYSFMQLPLLTAREFMREAEARGVRLTPKELEAFHRFKVVFPLLRYRREGRIIAARARRGDRDAWQAASWYPGRLDVLREVRSEGRLSDPADEPFVAYRRQRHHVREIEYSENEYLYAHHQLLLLPLARQLRPFFRSSRSGDLDRCDVAPWWRHYAIARGAQLRAVAIALTALEPVYYPRVIQRIRYSTEDEYLRYERWVRDLGIRKMLTWLGVDADWLKGAGEMLLHWADTIDPLGDWLELVREAHPRALDEAKRRGAKCNRHPNRGRDFASLLRGLGGSATSQAA